MPLGETNIGSAGVCARQRKALVYSTPPCLIMVFNRRIDDMQKVMLRGGNGSRQACAFFGEKLSQLISIMLLVPQVYPSYPPLVFGFLFFMAISERERKAEKCLLRVMV